MIATKVTFVESSQIIIATFQVKSKTCVAAQAHRRGDNVAVWAHHTFTLNTTHIFIEIQTKPRNMNTSSGGVDDDSRRPAVSDRRSTKRMREVLLSEFNGARDLSELRFLLTRGASVNVPFKDKSWETTYAILEVVRQKYWDDDWVFQKIRLLCRFGADVNISNANGITGGREDQGNAWIEPARLPADRATK